MVQLFVCLNSAAFVPPIATLVTVSTPDPVFFKVTGTGALSVPAACDPNFTAEGVRVPPGVGGVVFRSINTPPGEEFSDGERSIAMSDF